MRLCYVILLLGFTMAMPACVPINKSIFDPKAPLQSRILPLEIHIMDPNVAGSKEIGEVQEPLLPSVRITEARYIIKKDFSRNVFEPGDPRWGHLVVRVGRKASSNWAWFAASISTLCTINFLGVPVYHQTSEVTLGIEILDAQRRPVTQLTAKGKGSQYAALYWGRSMTGVVNPELAGGSAPDFAGAQMVHAEAIRAALNDAKRQIEAQVNEINARLREAKTT